jgi:xanthine dehydrogenase molybdopterin-binding subunit B
MAEVTVEVETGRAKVLKVTAVNDLGTVINGQIVEGQIRGLPVYRPEGPFVVWRVKKT